MQELRKCIVKEKEAYFHKWSEIAQVIPPSVAMGGHGGGVIQRTLGIIEFLDNGSVHECYPNEIRFI
ncbi:hypothetical protein J2Z35_001206 [Acetoanaerobium pronyense]|uniref:Uncharacterized protein n=1 Tax=Acetoanaerobium pronyense TaxID=1482736 RepID=A0ABS4KI19_9FIRM|nr:hypothetical protein [Acetoanaerobium pronyense]MBP2027412.1 hypothetical protein [Acetoanaerobium pronyense]